MWKPDSSRFRGGVYTHPRACFPHRHVGATQGNIRFSERKKLKYSELVPLERITYGEGQPQELPDVEGNRNVWSGPIIYGRRP